jgi:hypothetical protein
MCNAAGEGDIVRLPSRKDDGRRPGRRESTLDNETTYQRRNAALVAAIKNRQPDANRPLSHIMELL